MGQKEKKSVNIFKIFGRIIFVMLIALCAVFVFFNITHSYFVVYGPSMTPTLNVGVVDAEESKDGVFVSKIKGYSRGDIIVANKNYNVEGAKEQFVIKRVIAIGGDKIKIDEQDGFSRILLIKNGDSSPIFLDEPYLEDYSINMQLKDNFMAMVYSLGLQLDEMGFLTIEENEVFYLGDNRLNSKDCSTYGPKNKNAIVGKVDYIIYGNTNMYGQVIQQVFGW